MSSLALLALALAPIGLGTASHGHDHVHLRRDAPLNDLESLAESAVGFVPRRGYKLTWADEFWQIPGSQLPSDTNWLFDLGTSYPGGAEKWGNNETETYTNSPSNVHITKANTLAITPRKSKHDGTWTSARLETQRTDFLAAPGGRLYIEGRIKTGCADPMYRQGIWPAFWALGEDFRGNPTFWPMASEWDFLEVINGLPKIYNTLHCGVAPGGPCNEYNGLGNGGVPWSRCQWHTLGFEVDRTTNSSLSQADAWKSEKLTWFMDGVKVHQVTGSDVNDSKVWESVAHKGHFLLLNVAVGGYWPGQPNELTMDGPKVQLEVDYVRVYNSL
ncbi:glycoside hydrolase family 16 protein [Plenodomus tracheiphilus IPT5]|uniref:Glycoside hydrolase family 16 protein n=1 Tax=Plenodomus tracheiphilus IPT5 TaxID=1408161 RepID=A0A6A7B666_9PLEO|nr:glycoside hydrolase family 16 protein [Plenodomus tracheiphilus IPT5]